MELQVKIHVSDDLIESKSIVERIVNENLGTKLDHYLNKFKKEDAEGVLDLTVNKNKRGLFDAKLQVNLDGKIFRYEREDYKNLDDLVNHLFVHFKEGLSEES